jgi:REP element-mobilizing transposase RayT
VNNEKVFLNEPGKMIESWWKKIEQKYSEAVLDKYIIMPNHFHGIIMLIRDFYVGGGHMGPPLQLKQM